MNLSQLDYQLFQTINHFAERFPALNPLMAFCAVNLDYLFYLGVIVYWFVRTPENRPNHVRALRPARCNSIIDCNQISKLALD